MYLFDEYKSWRIYFDSSGKNFDNYLEVEMDFPIMHYRIILLDKVVVRHRYRVPRNNSFYKIARGVQAGEIAGEYAREFMGEMLYRHIIRNFENMESEPMNTSTYFPSFFDRLAKMYESRHLKDTAEILEEA